MTYADDVGGETLREWKDVVQAYVLDRPEVLDARQSPTGEPPWPAPENPMFGYLLARAREIEKEGGALAAMIWLGSHAWFEGGLDAMHRAAYEGEVPT